VFEFGLCDVGEDYRMGFGRIGWVEGEQ